MLRTNEQIFDDTAKGIMSQWDLTKFKKSHPALMAVIIQAMRAARKEAADFITNKSDTNAKD
jgi:hypothetical protein